MSHGPTHIPSQGYCIYCKKSGVRLTDEHIMPYFIGGAHVLKEASCDSCAKITSRFELDVSRELWGDARIVYNAPSRRKKKRPKHILMRDEHNPGHKMKIPVKDCPAAMVFYKMPKAGILQGLPESVDLSQSWELVSPVDEDKINNFTAKYGQRPVMSFRHVPDSFARLLVKIAYGQALCTLAPEDFHPICLPYILGQKKNLSYIVGGRGSYSDIKPELGYEMKTIYLKAPDKLLIIVEIRILPNSSTPTYHIVVGYVEGEKNSDQIYEKFKRTDSFDITNRSTKDSINNEDLHWMPSIWPLPGLS